MSCPTTQILAVALVGLAWLGCNDEPAAQSTVPLSDHLEELGEHVEALEAALELHGTSVAQALDLAAVTAAEEEQDDEVSEHMAELHHEIDEMAACADESGMAPDTDQLMGHMSHADEEHDAHFETMTTAVDLESAHSEELRHQQAMAEILGDLRETGDGMMGHEMMGGPSAHHCRDEATAL